AANGQGQPGLWRLGVSGGFPVVVVRVAAPPDLPLARALLTAHTYWRGQGRGARPGPPPADPPPHLLGFFSRPPGHGPRRRPPPDRQAGRHLRPQGVAAGGGRPHAAADRRPRGAGGRPRAAAVAARRDRAPRDAAARPEAGAAPRPREAPRPGAAGGPALR